MKKSIKLEEVPYAELKKVLGMGEEDFLNLPPKVLDRVMMGRISPLMQLKVDTGNFIAEGLMKFGLERDNHGALHLKLFPMEKKLKYDQTIKPEEMHRMKNGEAVLKEIERDGHKEKMYIQLDRETNNILELKASALKVPEAIADVVLSPSQKQQIREGKPIQVDRENTKVTLGVDLDDVSNFRVLEGDLKEWREQKLMKWDRLNRGVATGWWRTSENQWQLKQFNLEREFGQELAKGQGRGMSMQYGLKR